MAGRVADSPPPGNERRPESSAATMDDRVIVTGIKATDNATVLEGVTEDRIPELLEGVTTELMRRCGFPCRCEVVPGEYHSVKLVTDDRSAGVLIGRHGATVDAVEHIIERMASGACDERVKMNLDINNYRRRRESMLVERVADALQHVKTTGREARFEALCARERRIVHLAVLDKSGYKTSTVQADGGKQVVITLADGNEDAVVSQDDEVVPSTESGAEVVAEDVAEDAAEVAAEVAAEERGTQDVAEDVTEDHAEESSDREAKDLVTTESAEPVESAEPSELAESTTDPPEATVPPVAAEAPVEEEPSVADEAQVEEEPPTAEAAPTNDEQSPDRRGEMRDGA